MPTVQANVLNTFIPVVTGVAGTGSLFATLRGKSDSDSVFKGTSINSQVLVNANVSADANLLSMYRVWFRVDLSPVPANAVITQVTLRLRDKSQAFFDQGQPPVGSSGRNVVTFAVGDGHSFNFGGGAGGEDSANWGAITSQVTAGPDSVVTNRNTMLGGTNHDLIFGPTQVQERYDDPGQIAAICVLGGWDFDNVDPYTDYVEARLSGVDRITFEPLLGGLVKVFVDYVLASQTLTPGRTDRTHTVDGGVPRHVHSQSLLVRAHSIPAPTLNNSSPIITAPTTIRAHTVFAPQVNAARLMSLIVRAHTVFAPQVHTRPAIVGGPVVLPNVLNVTADDENISLPVTILQRGHEPVPLDDAEEVTAEIYAQSGALVASGIACTIVSPENGSVTIPWNKTLGAGLYYMILKAVWNDGTTTIAPSSRDVLVLKVHA